MPDDYVQPRIQSGTTSVKLACASTTATVADWCCLLEEDKVPKARCTLCGTDVGAISRGCRNPPPSSSFAKRQSAGVVTAQPSKCAAASVAMLLHQCAWCIVSF